jgi:type I restriction enzyme, S subunit
MKYNYKNTGIEWLGEIPKHWYVKRLFNICAFVRGNSSFQKNELLSKGKYVALQYGKTYKVEEVNEQFNFYVNDDYYNSSQTANFGDVIFVSTSETMEDLGHSVLYNRKDIGLIGGEQILLKPTKNILDGKYLFYTSKVFGKELKKFATGIKVFRFDIYDLKTIYTPLPPLSEQKAIADYLDKACQRIDKIIAIKQKQLEKIEGYLYTKITDWVTKGISESEIEQTDCLWIPEVKKGWKIKPLKRMLTQKLKYGANESAENENKDEPRYIRITDFGDDGYLKDSTFKSLPVEVAKPYMLQEGDVLFARSGATVGKTFIFRNYTGEACFAGYLIKANCDRSKLLPEYLYYFSKSKAYEEWKDLIFTQATIQNIGADKYQYLLLPQPNISEQQEIIDAIKILWDKIENLKNKIENQITTLQSYRKSLIHECVTGKKQVWEGELEN